MLPQIGKFYDWLNRLPSAYVYVMTGNEPDGLQDNTWVWFRVLCETNNGQNVLFAIFEAKVDNGKLYVKRFPYSRSADCSIDW